MNRYKLIISSGILLLFVVLMFSNCFNLCCKSLDNKISIPINVLERYKGAPKNYCCTLKSAINGDLQAIKQVSLYDFRDGFTYEHGNTLLELITIVGESEYLKAIETVNDSDKKKIISYLNAGIDFSNDDKFKDKKVAHIYPELSRFLE